MFIESTQATATSVLLRSLLLFYSLMPSSILKQNIDDYNLRNHKMEEVRARPPSSYPV